jgi:hypothetical protein
VKISEYPKTLARKEQYTPGDLAILLGISSRTAAKLLDRGTVKSFKFPESRGRRIHHADLVVFLKSDPCYRYALDKIADPEGMKSE